MIVITGANGQLGSAFVNRLPDAVALTRRDLDLTQPSSIRKTISELHPSVVINCAAYTAVDLAESDADTARLVNAESVTELAKACVESGSKFVTFSTDYVFDGNKDAAYVESDTVCPMSVYGATKAEGEEGALSTNPASLIVRTSWVLSGTHPNFASTMLKLAAHEGAKVVNDQVGRPTMVNDLAAATLDLLEEEATGLVHAANQGVVSWYQLALEIFAAGGFSADLLTPCGSDEFPRPAARPRNSVLDSERFGDRLPHYRNELVRAVRSIQSQPKLLE